MKNEIISGIVSGLVVLVIGGLVTWYLGDFKQNLEINSRVSRMESDQHQIQNKIDTFSENLNNLKIMYARLDERINSLQPYNQSKIKEISNMKGLSKEKIDAAVTYFNSSPNRKDAINYLEKNLGFSPKEIKAVIKPAAAP